MNKKLGAIVAVAIILSGFFLSNVLSNQKQSVRRKTRKTAVTNYRFRKIKNQYEKFDIELSGTLHSFNTIALFAEVTGIARSGKKEFREGTKFQKGDILIKIDDKEYKNSLFAQKSNFMNNLTKLIPDMKLDFPKSAKKWENYLTSFNITKELKPLPKPGGEKEKYYVASKNIYNQYYSIKSMEARLNKYTIKAPFDGIITQASIKPGTLVRAAQNIGVYQNINKFELVAFANVTEVKLLKIGMPVKLISNDMEGEFYGKIARINKSIEKTSQKVKVYITTQSDNLIDGLYLHGRITVETKNKVTKLPSEAIFRQGEVWVNKEGLFQSQNIQIIKREDNFVLVHGLKENQEVLLNPDKNISENQEIRRKKTTKKDK